MLKNKNAMSEIVATALIIVLTLAAVAVIWAWVLPLLNSPAYIITKQECHNESLTVGYKDFNFIMNGTYVSEKSMGYGSYDYCEMFYRQLFYNDRTDIKGCELHLLNVHCYNYTEKIETILYDNTSFKANGTTRQFCEYDYLVMAQKAENEQKQVCEQKEVEEIHYCEKGYTLYGEDGKKAGDWTELEMCSNDNPRPLSLRSPQIVAKNSLDNEWLDENCLCSKFETKLSSKIYDFVHGNYWYNSQEVNETGYLADSFELCSSRMLKDSFSLKSCFVSDRWKCSEYKCGNYGVQVK